MLSCLGHIKHFQQSSRKLMKKAKKKTIRLIKGCQSIEEAIPELVHVRLINLIINHKKKKKKTHCHEPKRMNKKTSRKSRKLIFHLQRFPMKKLNNQKSRCVINK